MVSNFIDPKGIPSPTTLTKHALAPGWAAFFGFVVHHADALGLVSTPFPVPIPGSAPDVEGGRANA